MDNKEPKTCMTDGSPVDPSHKDIDEKTGMQKGYVALCPEERAKGFVRPVRQEYVHVGKRPKYPLRDLTNDEMAQYKEPNSTKFEEYPESESPQVGRIWDEKDLNSGCGTKTTMNIALAETYARDPKFYGGTFCVGCRTHFPIAEFVWAGTEEVVGS